MPPSTFLAQKLKLKNVDFFNELHLITIYWKEFYGLNHEISVFSVHNFTGIGLRSAIILIFDTSYLILYYRIDLFSY